MFLVDVNDINHCEGDVDSQLFFNSIMDLDRWEMFPVFLRKYHQTAAVVLVRLVLAVLDIVADQLGVDAGPEVAAEVPGLREISVEI